MKPIRNERNLQVIHEPWGFKARSFQEEDISHLVSDEGGLESHHLSRQVAFDCGCLDKPRGGFCADCVSEGARGLICASCFAHCLSGGCGRPICLRHSFYMYEGDQEFRLCFPCAEAVRRKQITQGIIRFVLSPFVRPDEDQ